MTISETLAIAHQALSDLLELEEEEVTANGPLIRVIASLVASAKLEYERERLKREQLQ